MNDETPEQSHSDLQVQKLFLFGKPGSGKGTLTQDLIQFHASNGRQCLVMSLSAGDLLRAEAAKTTPEGKALKALLDEGNYAPTATTIRLVQEEIDRQITAVDQLNHAPDHIEDRVSKILFIIDGYPRDEKQLQSSLQSDLLNTDSGRDICLFLDVGCDVIPDQLPQNPSVEHIPHRLRGRWNNPVTGAPFHETIRPPRKNAAGNFEDPDTGEILKQRGDDTDPNSVNKRLHLYALHVPKVLEALRDTPCYRQISINPQTTPGEVLQQANALLQPKAVKASPSRIGKI